MKTILRSFTAALLVLSLTGAADSSHAAGENEPVLKTDDEVRMDVFEESDLGVQTRILKSGDIVIPLVGSVKISGLTVAQAIKKITELYAADYLVSPRVTLTVVNYSQEFVTVTGAVASAGQIAIPSSGKLDISAAIAAAGGITAEADSNSVTLTRAGTRPSTYSISSIQNGNSIPLRAGDHLAIRRSTYVEKTITILGQVGKPGIVAFPNDGRLDLVTAVAMAGACTAMANPKKVSVNREGKVSVINLKEMTDSGEERYYLKPGDIITVPERIF